MVITVGDKCYIHWGYFCIDLKQTQLFWYIESTVELSILYFVSYQPDNIKIAKNIGTYHHDPMGQCESFLHSSILFVLYGGMCVLKAVRWLSEHFMFISAGQFGHIFNSQREYCEKESKTIPPTALPTGGVYYLFRLNTQYHDSTYLSYSSIIFHSPVVNFRVQ